MEICLLVPLILLSCACIELSHSICDYVGKIAKIHHFTSNWETESCGKFKQLRTKYYNKTLLHLEQTPARDHQMQKKNKKLKIKIKNLLKTGSSLGIYSGNLYLEMMQLVKNTKPYTYILELMTNTTHPFRKNWIRY